MFLAATHLSLPQYAAIAAAAGILIGWIFATAMRRQDHRTYILGRAPALPIRALSEHDDAWLRGTIRSEQPLTCPWFEVACVAYSYSIEKKTTKRYTDSKGKRRSRTSWDTIHSDSSMIDCELDDGEYVKLALREASLEAMGSLGTDYEHSKRRHSASALQIGETVSTLGVLREDKTFGPYREIPLVVTYQERDSRIARAASKETWYLFFAMLFPYVGVVLAASILREAQVWQDVIIPAAIGLGITIPQWSLLTYNRLVRLRQQVLAAEKQISIELAMRTDLIPNLVTCIEAASQHEQGLLADLAKLRTTGSVNQQINAEEVARKAASSVLALHESYPKLTSDKLYRDLHERLWAIEEKIAHSRGFWNDTVTEWNDRLQKVPSNLIAMMAKMQPRPLFQADENVQLPPRLNDIAP